MAGGQSSRYRFKKMKIILNFVKTLAYSDIWFHNSKNKNSRAILSYDMEA